MLPTLAVALAVLAAAPARSAELIVAGESVGPLRKDMSETELIRAVGGANVQSSRCRDASVVFPNDPARRMEILWTSAAHDHPALVVLRAGARYRTPSGVRLGTTLAQLEQLNGRYVGLSGWSWSGDVTQLDHGALEPELSGIALTVSTGDSDAPASDDDALPLAAPSVRALRPAVASIRVHFATLPAGGEACALPAAQPTDSSSTSKTSVEFGGMTGG